MSEDITKVTSYAKPETRKTIEFWAKKNETPDWLFYATKAGRRWAQGMEVEEKDYLAACEATANAPIGTTQPK